MAGRNNPTLVCVPLVAKTVEQMLSDMIVAKAAGADLVEIRLDHLAAFRPRQDLELLLRARPLPALVTYRPKWEGGEYEGDEVKRLDVLRLAMEMGADYVDVELKVAPEFANSVCGRKPEKCKLIVSSHNYQSTPSIEVLGNLVARIQATGADIVKIATTAVNITDVARMFQVMVHCQVPMIGLVMKERGIISRILCPKFGGYLTFAILDGGKESAPGQPTITDLLNVYNIRTLRSDTKVYGIIGKPVSHSKSPILHNAAFISAGVNAVYVPFLVDDTADFLSVYSSPDFAGFSCTIPHKEAAAKCCDEVDPIAKSIGAVNTIIQRPNDRKLIGYNTDYIGAISAIEDAMRGSHANNSNGSPLSGKLFVVIGAGGAGKALAYGAKDKGAKVVIVNRTFDRARDLAMLVGADAISLAELDSFHPEEGMILANTTSIGMHPNVDDTPLSKLQDC
uniref:Bifunctional 3-dehydroquinate dehydratase/shikimate dehydrogenase, chloroplastic n=1 Tax=Anthurium amnicola TaxID=1678845 RepID=A0A1D1ZK98_9ARAE